MSGHKIRVAVLYGGRSGEHEVSLQSAASIVKNIDKSKFDVVPIGIDKLGHWRLGNQSALQIEGKSLRLPEFDGKSLKLPSPKANVVIAPQPDTSLQEISESAHIEGLESVDVVFPILHGPLGEDGTVQGLLELAEIPYVGPGVLSSAVGMDKDVAKRLAKLSGIRVGDYIAVNQGQWQRDPDKWYKEVATTLSYPVFVKPANSGSSVGIHKVKSEKDLAHAMNDAFLYDTKVLIEQAVNAREIELAVLENSEYGKDPLVSIAGEIIPHHEFYSYEAKYLDPDGAALAIPANITPAQMREAQMIAQKLFMELGCEGMARVDLFLDRETGMFYFNEVNTIPGFTQISMYPKLWMASGISYSDLITQLIELAMARHSRKQQLSREWIAN